MFEQLLDQLNCGDRIGYYSTNRVIFDDNLKHCGVVTVTHIFVVDLLDQPRAIATIERSPDEQECVVHVQCHDGDADSHTMMCMQAWTRVQSMIDEYI